MRRLGVPLAVCLLNSRLLAAQVAEVRLGPPTASPDEAFTEVGSAVELRGDRLLVADTREQRLVLMDLAAGTARNIGRTGGGPGEFRLIGALLPRPSGGAWVADFGLRRLLPVEPDGTFGAPVRYPGSISVHGTDGQGRLYGDAYLPRGTPAARDSMLLLRWDVETDRFDSLMNWNASVSSWTGRGGAAMRLYAPTDAWVALPSGEILVVRGEDYRFTSWRDGRAGRSFAVPWQPIPVTDADRKTIRDRMASQRTRSLGNPGAAGSAPPRIEIEFPATYPPFGGEGGGATYMRYAPKGHVWIQRLQPAADSAPLFDVVDVAAGRLLARVRLQPRASLLAFGSGGVYVSELDADDVARVRRYAYPSLSGR